MDNDLQLPDIRSDEFIQRVDGLRSDLRKIKERWDNRLILENSPFGELYINGRVEIVFYGDWGVGADKYHWFVSVPNNRTIFDRCSAGNCIDIGDACDRNDGQEITMLIMIAETCNRPEVKIRVPARLYICKDMICQLGENLLYRSIVPRGFKIFPFVMKREIGLLRGRTTLNGDNGSSNPNVQGLSEIVNRVPHDATKVLRDWLFGPVGQLKTVRVRQQHCGPACFDPNLIEFSGEGGRLLDKRINVAVGPLDLESS